MPAWIGVLVGALIGGICSVALTEPLGALAARFLGPVLPASRRVRGLWTSSYEFTGAAGRERMEQTVRVYQIGSFVYGRCISSSRHRHRIRARIRGDYLTGEWSSLIKESGHFGAMQLYIRPTGHEMRGRYLGFDSETQVLSEEWIWTRQ